MNIWIGGWGKIFLKRLINSVQQKWFRQVSMLKIFKK
jgi:hypothetical protein